LVTIGIKPTWACPGFGYIEMGKKIALTKKSADAGVHEVVRFREKPEPKLAEKFLKQGNFRWNAGMFAWTIPAILSPLEKHAPPLAKFAAQMRRSKNMRALIKKKFVTLPKISIDFAIMEKAGRVLVVEAAFDWDDVGGWTAIAKYLDTDK